MLLIAALFGLIVGSFLNVVILRHGARSLGGRSACFSCGTTIAWYDNLPVLSYLLLRGRCRHCKSRIAVQYPLVEAATALLFAMLAALLAPVALVDFFALAIAWMIAGILICIFVYDLRHTIIPDAWAYLFAALALGGHLLDTTVVSPVYLLLSGPAVALPLFMLWLLSHGRWMGLGDAKLCLGIGWLLGALYGIAAVFLAFMIGAVVSLAILIPLPHYRRVLSNWGLLRHGPAASFTMKSEVPFGPFLIAGTFIVWFMYLLHVPLLA